ncbi:hypothetical protein AB4Z39_10750 [Mycobacterium adipatum]|uniref:hypothetical protein n=1 Tax=Mycobacterium adipatum TaxID=1682113 RepID=UPI0034E0636C
MAELVFSDLPESVLARFDDNDAAQAAIDAALIAARRYCGWHVSPVRVDESIELDGPGGQELSLPTMRLNVVTSVTELGRAVDVSKLDKSRRKGTLTKPYGRWTCRDGAITAVITHGFTEAEAADWRAAIVKLVDEGSQSSDRTSADMKRWKVDDVEYEWFEALVSTNDELAAKFSQFRILPSP